MSKALDYSKLLLTPFCVKNFSCLGRECRKSGDWVARLLDQVTLDNLEQVEVARLLSKNCSTVFYITDDTLLSKIYAEKIEGTWQIYSTVEGKCINGYRLLVGAIVCNGRIIPIHHNILLPKELCDDPSLDKTELVKKNVQDVIELFPDKRIIVVADGAFATIEMLRWCIENTIAIEMRMHSNRKVLFNGELVTLKKIKKIIPKGRQMGRTVKIEWYDLGLYVTAHRRINKHQVETVVYQVSTFKAKPGKHIKIYKQRWKIENLFRTLKQSLGLQDCQSTSFEKQHKHIKSTLVSYARLQLRAHINGYKTPEAALRASGEV